MRYKIDDVVGELTDLPGCSQIAVSHNVFVPTGERGKGKGKRAHVQRLAYIEDLGYDYTLCTVSSDNRAEIRILEENLWTCLDSFRSTKTGHLVYLYGRHIVPKSDSLLIETQPNLVLN